jgi:hypothetical protein
VVSESILAAADEELSKQIQLNGYRSVDDYEFGFPTHSAAENALAVLQSVLSEYELQLNPRKTEIVELPIALDAPWASELRVFQIRPRSQSNDLLRYFSRAFELAKSFPEENVLKFAISRMDSVVVGQSNWTTYQDILLQCAMVEPGSLPFVIDQLLRYAPSAYQVNTTKLQSVFHSLISTHGPLAQGSEVAWAVWGTLLFNIPIDDSTADILGAVEDPIVALLTLDAKNKQLISSGVGFSRWQACMNQVELHGSQWLLAYEANVKGWLPSVSGQDYVRSDPCFSYLKKNNVQFYDDAVRTTHAPRKPIATHDKASQEQGESAEPVEYGMSG